mgnify:CR=1 FL=1
MEKLTSVLKNVPLPLMDRIRKYRTKNSIYEVNWKYREPKKGEKYRFGGTLRRDQAKSADMYVSTREFHQELFQKVRNDYKEEIEMLKAQLTNALDADESTSEALAACQKRVQVCENIIKNLCLLL